MFFAVVVAVYVCVPVTWVVVIKAVERMVFVTTTVGCRNSLQKLKKSKLGSLHSCQFLSIDSLN